MIARVVVDSPLPHLDRPFDYDIPASLAGLEVGTRVRVPFAGRLASAVVVELAEASDAGPLKAVKSAAALPSFSAGGLELARLIAHRYGGSWWDMLRLMAPPRVAGVERKPWASYAPTSLDDAPDAALAALEAAASARGIGGPGERSVWAAAPAAGEPLPAEAVLGAAVRMARAGGTAIVACADARAGDAVLRAATAAGLRRWAPGKGGHVAVLDADDGPAARYAAHLAAMRGLVPLVIGTRQAAWQPVARLAGIVVWDEASSAHEEPRAPYPHARTVAALRAHTDGTALVIGGHVVSAEAVALVEHGFARKVDDAAPRAAAAAMEVVGAEERERQGGVGLHWLPPAARAALLAEAEREPCAVLVPQGGYAAGLACADCGALAECRECGGDLARATAQASVACRDCGTEAVHWHCPTCTGYRLRPVGLGIERVAGQLARMFPGREVVASAASVGVIRDGAVKGPALVVATPGALPAVPGGYARLVIVGAHVQVSEGLGAEAGALRRWLNAAALVRSRAEGGRVVVVGDLESEVRRCLVSWDGWDASARDFEQRVELGLPPSRRSMRLDGPQDAIDEVGGATRPHGGELSRDADGAWLLATRGAMQACVTATRAVVVARSKAGLPPLYVRVDALPGT